METVLLNGIVIDPQNRINSRLNIGIKDGRIAAVTSQNLSAKNVFDCSGLIIAPGFVDVHMHEDYREDSGELMTTTGECMLRMGVTTALGGNCGDGPDNLPAYKENIARNGYPVNLALLSAHGALRRGQGDFNKYEEVTTQTIEMMGKQLEAELQQGSFGLSFGIRYIPGMNYQEMESLCKIVKKYQGVVAAHIRDDAKMVFQALQEFMQLGRDTGVKLQVSHLGSMAAYGQMEEALGMIDEYGATGNDISVDCYPYSAFLTSIGATTFDDGFLDRYGIDYSSLEIAQGKYKGQRATAQSFHETRQNHPDCFVVGHVMKENEVEMALKHPKVCVGSDGILHGEAGHPRVAGTFPRFLREYVYKRGMLDINQAIKKITSQPAQRFSLNKGTLSIGAAADITVFNPLTIQDTATFEQPLLVPQGVEYVFLAGHVALKSGVIINKQLGKVLRKNAAIDAI